MSEGLGVRTRRGRDATGRVAAFCCACTWSVALLSNGAREQEGHRGLQAGEGGGGMFALRRRLGYQRPQVGGLEHLELVVLGQRLPQVLPVLDKQRLGLARPFPTRLASPVLRAKDVRVVREGIARRLC